VKRKRKSHVRCHVTLLLMFAMAFTAPSRAATIAPGLYRDAAGTDIYVGTEHELPDPAYSQYLNAARSVTGALSSPGHLTLLCKIGEERHLVRTPAGVLGVSLYYVGNAPRATVLLIHGADAETREMGWIVPYFACNGVNVISYDQRGTGESSGDWLMNGPLQRARDADAIYDALPGDPRVDPRRIGVWGFSNGGWTAPIVAVDRPLAFMMLKSAPAESVERNLYYEARQSMRSSGHGNASVKQAVVTWQAIIGALQGRTRVSTAKKLYAQAKRTAWFADSLLGLFPAQTAFVEPQLSGWRRFVSYDPAPILVKVRTPTLALYGARDQKTDVNHDVPVLQAAFRKAGIRDLTVRWFAGAGHTLEVSGNRYSGGYPNVMLLWLRARGLAGAER
jgi:uncharacterized protein